MKNLLHQDYTIAWVCALPLEMAAAKAMLDEIHPALPTHADDHNTYVLGLIRAHNVVIACLPSGLYGITSAATVAAQMLLTFTSIRFGLLVGIGGGVPSKDTDIRLGDVVVSKPTSDFGGVIQYDFGKTIGQGSLKRIGMLNRPPQILLTAIAKLQADQMLERSRIPGILSEVIAMYPRAETEFTYPWGEQDSLFESAYEHPLSDNSCDDCETSRLVPRPARNWHGPVVHYGVIASGNQVMKNAGTRDKLAEELGIICFEMEATGVMNHFPCLVIRGICDYADSHKNKRWQRYAAATAAAYAKEVFSVIHANSVIETPAVVSVTHSITHFELVHNSETTKYGPCPL
jgi:nucleoside phosphorylase